MQNQRGLLQFLSLILLVIVCSAVSEPIDSVCEESFMRTMNPVLSFKRLPSSGPLETLSPFLFFVYHKDFYPAGDSTLGVPGKHGNTQDFNPTAPYRFYHGVKLPGFPQHPHRGFETLTCTLQGFVDHSDSLGNCGRYGNGDLQWMSAGSGVVHGENFPLIHSDKPNTLRLFQIWLNLPKASKMTPPDFVMHWKEQIPKLSLSSPIDTNKLTQNNTISTSPQSPDIVTEEESGTAEVTVFAGNFNDTKSLKPTKHSYANDPNNEVAVLYLKLLPNSQLTLPIVQNTHSTINRSLYLLEGKSLTLNHNQGSKTYSKTKEAEILLFTLNSTQSVTLSNEHKTDVVELLLLQGKPISEKVVQRGPFVMNSEEEIRETFEAYRKTQFGGWPWKDEQVVFEREKERFARINGVEVKPPPKV